MRQESDQTHASETMSMSLDHLTLPTTPEGNCGMGGVPQGAQSNAPSSSSAASTSSVVCGQSLFPPRAPPTPSLPAPCVPCYESDGESDDETDSERAVEPALPGLRHLREALDILRHAVGGGGDNGWGDKYVRVRVREQYFLDLVLPGVAVEQFEFDPCSKKAADQVLRNVLWKRNEILKARLIWKDRVLDRLQRENPQWPVSSLIRYDTQRHVFTFQPPGRESPIFEAILGETEKLFLDAAEKALQKYRRQSGTWLS